jgi:hypothetical protein
MLYAVKAYVVGPVTTCTVLVDVRRSPDEREVAKSDAVAFLDVKGDGRPWAVSAIQAVCETPNRVLMVVK